MPFQLPLTKTRFSDLLANTTFARLLAGRIITDAGDSLYYIGSMWLVYDLTGSTFYTGLAAALLQVPNVLSFLVGPLIDRWDLRPILLGTQLTNALGVLIVPLVATLGHLTVWWVLILMPILDLINGFVYPAQNAALPKIVGSEQLTRANSMFTTSIRTVGMIANAVAGVLISALGAIALFAIDATTFVLAGVLFLGVTTTNTTDDQSNTSDDATTDDSYLTDLRGGIAYVRGSALSVILLGMMLGNFVSVAVNVVLPAFANSIGGPSVYGFLMAAMGAGNLAGAAVASYIEQYTVGQIAVGSNLTAGVFWIAAVMIPGSIPTMALLFGAVLPVGAFNVIYGSMYQSAVDDSLLGRVSSLTRTLSSVMMPLGGLVGGATANVISSQGVLYIVGGTHIVLAVFYLSHPRIRSLPTVVDADEAALGL
uniref:MFS transporter n=1 Tax=Halobacterium sp. (strain GN101) TaxID=88773 RepID=UPI00159EDFC4|nr:MFS transporter [Halobacterium sp. GN101]